MFNNHYGLEDRVSKLETEISLNGLHPRPLSRKEIREIVREEVSRNVLARNMADAKIWRNSDEIRHHLKAILKLMGEEEEEEE